MTTTTAATRTADRVRRRLKLGNRIIIIITLACVANPVAGITLSSDLRKSLSYANDLKVYFAGESKWISFDVEAGALTDQRKALVSPLSYRWFISKEQRLAIASYYFTWSHESGEVARAELCVQSHSKAYSDGSITDSIVRYSVGNSSPRLIRLSDSARTSLAKYPYQNDLRLGFNFNNAQKNNLRPPTH